jgi:hypothetical protein
MSFDRYNILKEQCDICKSTGMATDDDCAGCQRGAAIREYETRAEEPRYIVVPVFSEEKDEFGEYQIIGYRKEYV